MSVEVEGTNAAEEYTQKRFCNITVLLVVF